jgi:hypothetical protein
MEFHGSLLKRHISVYRSTCEQKNKENFTAISRGSRNDTRIETEIIVHSYNFL